jgi:hypothetical protein
MEEAMTIEHRWGVRQAADFEVIIDYPRLGLVRGRIRDISVTGLYVETNIRLPLHTCIDLTLVYKDDGKVHKFNWQAMVTRVTSRGAGMMLDRFDMSELAKLFSLIGGGPGHEHAYRAPHQLRALI